MARQTIAGGQTSAEVTNALNANFTELYAGQENGAVTSDKIAADAVTSTKIADGAVTTDKLGSNAVTTSKIASGAISADKLDNNIQLTLNKVKNITISASNPTGGSNGDIWLQYTV